MRLIASLQLHGGSDLLTLLKCMKKVKPSSRSKVTEDIISIRSFVEVLVLNHYVLVRKILEKLSKLQDEDAQNKTNIQVPRKLWWWKFK
ncbi:hypothetical protein Tco_0083050 [Tanacetum coccineum]